MDHAALPLSEMAERTERLLRLSPADSTIVTWLEGARHHAVESPRGRRSGSESFRTVILRVRSGRRSGLARAETGARGELEAALRQALSVAHAATISSEWIWPSEAPTRTNDAVLHDASLAGLPPTEFLDRLQAFPAKRKPGPAAAPAPGQTGPLAGQEQEPDQRQEPARQRAPQVRPGPAAQQALAFPAPAHGQRAASRAGSDPPPQWEPEARDCRDRNAPLRARSATGRHRLPFPRLRERKSS